MSSQRDKSAVVGAEGSAPRATWELELIVSGAVIVGLFQLPGMLTDWFEATELHLSSQAFWLPYFVYYLSMTAVVGLIVVFTIHFALRCLWVGVLGLKKAYPEGIDWDKIDLGPLQRDYYRKRLVDLADWAPSLDRTASSVFAVLFVVIAYVGLIAVYVVVTYLLATLLDQWVPGGSQAEFFLFVSLGLVVVPLLIAGLVIQWVDSRLAKDETFVERHAALVRFARFLLRVSSALVMARLSQPVVMTLRSRMSNTRFVLVSNAVVLMFVVLVVAVMFVAMGLLRGDSYRYFPDWPGVHAYDPDHYLDQRDQGSDPYQPWVDADLIEKPMLRVFLPFRARVGNEMVAEHCPDLEAFHDDGLRMAPRRDAAVEPPDQVARAVACISALYQVTLNGQPVAGSVLLGEDPQTGVRGLVKVVGGEAIHVGHNQLVVIVQQRTAGDDSKIPLHREYTIPFWFYPET